MSKKEVKKEVKEDKISNSELEQLFNNLQNTVGAEIKDKLEQAEKLIGEAIQLSNNNGIPFYSSVCSVGQSYVPKSFDKFKSINKKVQDMTGVWLSDSYNRIGWEHSQIC